MRTSMIKKLNAFFPFSWKDLGTTLLIFIITTLTCYLLVQIDNSGNYVSMVYLIAVFFVSRFTNGYLFGILSSFLGVCCTNFFFTYPYLEFNLSLSGYPITFFVMLVISFITSTMTTQIKEQEKIRALAEREKLRSNLLRAVSHDLRTPLTSISGSLTILSDMDNQIGPEVQAELITDAKKEADWLIRMVENLLSVTKMEGGQTNLHKQEEAAEEIAAEAVSKFRKRYQEVSVKVSVPDELLLVPMDAILIEQVIVNILENAVDHGHTTTKIRFVIYRSEEDAIFEITDNGVGISPSVMPHLFDGYVKPNADSSKNMGIGLSVCMSIIKAHGGRMEAENSKDGGAQFRFTLPLQGESKL